MKHAMISGLTLCFVLMVGLPSTVAQRQTTSFAEIREMADRGVKEIDHDLFVEGIVISDAGNENLDLNLNRYYTTINQNENNRRAYIESLDGRYGLRLGFRHSAEQKMLPRYARVVLNLNGATLLRQGPKRYTVYGLGASNIVDVRKGTAADLPVKKRRIADLTDDDVYTFVTLENCEFAFKDGSYSNIYETYAIPTAINNQAGANNSMDGWATLLYDNDASPIYMLVNSRCPWRRSGNGVPKGAGELSGIVVYTHLPRYGGNVLGRYVMRPLNEADINISRDGESSFKVISEWNWNDGGQSFQTDKGSAKTLRNGRIKADIGAGTLYSTAGGTIVRGNDFNNPAVESPSVSWNRGLKGMIRQGAMLVRTEACNWWNWEEDRGNSIVIDFSTDGISGNNLMVLFTFGAGEINAQTSYGFPVYWCVEYSVDGGEFKRVNKSDIVLRSVPWWWINNVHGECYQTSTEAGMGFTEHMVVLPADAFGKKNVTVRISPSKKNAATLAYEQSNKGALRPNYKQMTSISFGAISVRYN